jgi:iron complex transport system substrate-binding protein
MICREKIMVRFIFFFCLLLQAIPAAGYAKTVTDQTGRTVTIPDNPQRIVSLMPSLTEMVYELGQGERIVAATQYSTQPAAVRQLPKVGPYTHPGIERILARQPDLCLVSRDGNPKFIVDRLESLGIAVYAFDPQSLAGIMDAVTRLGGIVHARAKAGELVNTMRRRLRNVDIRVQQFTRRPRVFFQIDAGTIVSAGPKSFIGSLITRAGGINLATGDRLYPRYSWEEVLAMQPEVIIISSMAGGYSNEQLKAQWQRWPELPAVRDHRIYVVDADRFDRPTVQSFTCLEELVDLLHKHIQSTN